MLRKRIIPIVLLDGYSVVKTIGFNDRRNLGSPITVIRTYNTRNVDELILLDIDASKQGRSIDRFTIQDIAKESFMPLTVGGGIRSIQDIESLLEVGADKITLNTFALERPNFINEAAAIFGSQCIVVSVDVVEMNDQYVIYNNGQLLSELNFDSWIVNATNLGAGEILINNVTRDGMMNGANTALAQHAAELVSIPIIYAGGVSSADDAAITAATSVSAVGISSIFHFSDATPENCRQSLKKLGIPAR